MVDVRIRWVNLLCEMYVSIENVFWKVFFCIKENENKVDIYSFWIIIIILFGKEDFFRYNIVKVIKLIR